jgi:peptidoglycan/LPS O-acetylase OafA/YrhL
LLRICVGFIVVALALRLGLVLMRNDVVTPFVLAATRADSLCVGAMVALAVRSPNGLGQIRRVAPVVAAVTSALLVLLATALSDASGDHPAIVTIGLTLLAFLFGAILVLIISTPLTGRLREVFAMRWLRFLGRHSYALYVVHHPILFFLPASLLLARTATVFGSQLPARLLFIAVAGILSLGLAVLSWHLYEKHFLKYKEFFAYGGQAGGS